VYIFISAQTNKSMRIPLTQSEDIRMPARLVPHHRNDDPGL